MKEETKEEYVARHRKELGLNDPLENPEESLSLKKPATLRERLNTVLFLAGFVLFLWMLLQIFGMMKSN